jgi:hypothetical protein
MQKWIRSSALVLGLALIVLCPARSQPAFSVDFQGPTVGTLGFSPGDIFDPAAPAIIFPVAGFGCVPSGTTLAVEVDAISYGIDPPLTQTNLAPRYHFSVDEFAYGIAFAAAAPNVTSEGATPGASNEASADIYVGLGIGAGPFPPPPPAGVLGNTGVWDGNGILPFPAPGLGLIEPNPPTPGFLPDPGDNLDALDMHAYPGTGIYFSLDAAWVDPLELPPANSGTALANAFLPGDILFTPGGGLPVVFAPSAVLGLGPKDDLDALLLWENGTGVYEPSVVPYDWVGGATDMVLFSVRRGSPIIGTPDAFWGAPIEEGDILVVTGGGFAVPGIFIPAEMLGLQTVRGGYPVPFGFGDDLDALGFPGYGAC